MASGIGEGDSGKTASRISVLLADDHQILREGLRSLLEAEGDIAVVGEAQDGSAAVQLAQRLRPRVVLMDVNMPALNGIAATRQIVSAAPGSGVLILTMYAERTLAVRALTAGARGYVLKDSPFSELLQAVRCVGAGGRHLCPKIAALLADGPRAHVEDKRAAGDLLSARERRVLQLIAAGLSAREAAEELGLSVKTVETHRSNIMRKLETRSIAKLTKVAIMEGLTTLEE